MNTGRLEFITTSLGRLIDPASLRRFEIERAKRREAATSAAR
jgi:hypothetical protein